MERCFAKFWISEDRSTEIGAEQAVHVDGEFGVSRTCFLFDFAGIDCCSNCKM